MGSYENVKEALDLTLFGAGINYKQLEFIQTIRELEEIEKINVSLIQHRENWTEINVSGAIKDKRILTTKVDPPNGEGIINFLKKYKLDKYISSEPSGVVGGMGINLFFGRISNLYGDSRNKIHYSMKLELLTEERFDESFR